MYRSNHQLLVNKTAPHQSDCFIRSLERIKIQSIHLRCLATHVHLHSHYKPHLTPQCSADQIRLELDQVHLTEIRRCATEHATTLGIQSLANIADPEVVAEVSHPMHFVVTNAQFITRNPDHWSAGTQRTVLKGPLHQLVTFIRGQVLQLVVDACEESISELASGRPLGLDVLLSPGQGVEVV